MDVGVPGDVSLITRIKNIHIPYVTRVVKS